MSTDSKLSGFSVIEGRSSQPFTSHMDILDGFVRDHDGDFSIHKILIANNGLAATKMIKSIRKWSFETFGNSRTINLLAMATRDDIEANAEFIKLADNYVEVPSGPNNFNYANVDLIVSLAEQYGVQVRETRAIFRV